MCVCAKPLKWHSSFWKSDHIFILQNHVDVKDTGGKSKSYKRWSGRGSGEGFVEQLLNIQRQKYRGIRLEQKRGVFQPFCTLSYYRWHQASLFLLVLSVFYVYCVVAVCVRDCFVHVQAESRYLCVSVWLCWYTVVFVTPWPSFYKRRQRSRAGLHQLHV